VTIVWCCALSVEAYAATGKKVAAPRRCCARCQSPMVFWGGYWRYVREGGDFRIWVRRARCCRCRVSTALLPSFCLAGRLYTAEVVGATVAGALDGRPLRPSEAVGATTAGGWRRRYRARAAALAAAVAAVTGRVVARGGAWPEGRGLAALEAVAVAAWVGVGAWPAVSLLTSGAWLSPTTTNLLFVCGPGRRLMVSVAPFVPRRPP
jgi:hypothetical protein